MIKILRVISSSYNSLKQSVIKLSGAKNTYTAEEYGPFGADSRPPKGWAALYSVTGADGDDAVLGYLNKDRLSEVGEMRIFATDADGNFKFNVWLRADGTVLIGGSSVPADYINYGVKFNQLETEFNKLKSDYNTLKTKFNSHTHTTTCGSGAGTAAAVLAAQQGPTNTSNIANAKNEEVKYT